MARKRRFNLPHIPQHVIQRGNNREPCFFSVADYRYYLDALKTACDKFDCSVHAYVLMTNHVHLLVTPAKGNSLSAMMQSLGRRYVRHINDQHKRTGTLWEGRYKACVVETGHYLLACYRYIELNPVRAGMVAVPSEYPWSSFRSNAGADCDVLVTSHAEYQALGPTHQARCRAYRELFTHHIPEEEIHVIRNSLNEELVLGSEYFKDRIEAAAKQRTRPGQAGRPARKAAR